MYHSIIFTKQAMARLNNYYLVDMTSRAMEFRLDWIRKNHSTILMRGSDVGASEHGVGADGYDDSLHGSTGPITPIYNM